MQQQSHPNLFRRRERTARFWPPPRPHGTDVAEVHTAGSHSRLRSRRMMAFGTPYQNTSKAMLPAPSLRQLAGKTMLLVLQLFLATELSRTEELVPWCWTSSVRRERFGYALK